MPRSTAETVTCASSPGASPVTAIGTLHGLARLRQRRRADGDVELVRVAVDGEPREPDRPARHAPRLDVERTVGQRDRVGARPPVGADRERDDVVAGDEVDVDEALDLVADQRDGRLAGVAAS